MKMRENKERKQQKNANMIRRHKEAMYCEKKLMDHAKALFPICRSITGNGIRKTLAYFERYHPELKRIRYKSGTKAFDWVIPLEWNISEAYIEHISTGKKYCELKNSNLHVVGYSEPINRIMDAEELVDRIYTQADKENAIPYVTSYYKRTWGFCMAEKEKKKLPDGKFKAVIDSNLKKGYLEMSHAVLKGQSREEVFISSYACHPSMANNELSGPIVLNALLDYIKNKYKKTRYSYRFLIGPETIGSIAYMSRYLNQMQKYMVLGINLSCVGDERGYSFVGTPYADTLSDKAMRATLGQENFKEYSFLERGSDERQYCSPGIELPVCTFSRSKFGEYSEYHTDQDNLDLITEDGLQGSFQKLRNIVDAMETSLYPILKTKGEPQLGKRGLYPTLSHNTTQKHPAKARMDILAYCNGKNTIFDICQLTNITLDLVIKELEIMIDNKIVKTNYRKFQ